MAQTTGLLAPACSQDIRRERTSQGRFWAYVVKKSLVRELDASNVIGRTEMASSRANLNASAVMVLLGSWRRMLQEY